MTVLIAMFSYITLLIFLLIKFNIWDITLLKDTLLWFIFAGFGMLLNINKIQQDDRYFKRLILTNLRLALVLEFIVNLYSFSLFIELILTPFLFIAIGLSTIAGIKSDHKAAKKFIDFTLSIFGIYLLYYAFVNIIKDFHNFTALNNIFAFLLPLALTFAFMPFLYFFALLATYESFYMRLGFSIKNREKLSKSAKIKIFNIYRFNLRKLNKMSNEIIIESLSVDNETDILGIVMRYR